MEGTAFLLPVQAENVTALFIIQPKTCNEELSPSTGRDSNYTVNLHELTAL